MKVNERQAADLAGVSVTTIRNWMHQGKGGRILRAERVSQAGEPAKLAIDTEDLAAFAPLDQARLKTLVQQGSRSLDSILARLATLEAQVHALQSSAFSARGPSDDLGERKRLIGVQAHYVPDSALIVTPGADQSTLASMAGKVTLPEFARIHGMPEPTAKRHRDDEKFEATPIPNKSRDGQPFWYILPTQQAGALTYWRDHWTPRGAAKLHRCDDPTCACQELLAV